MIGLLSNRISPAKSACALKENMGAHACDLMRVIHAEVWALFCSVSLTRPTHVVPGPPFPP